MHNLEGGMAHIDLYLTAVVRRDKLLVALCKERLVRLRLREPLILPSAGPVSIIFPQSTTP